MNWNDRKESPDPTIMGNERPRRDPEGREGAGSHQEGPHSKQAGYGDRKVKTEEPGSPSSPQKSPGSREQATHGPGDRHGEDRDTM